MEYKFKGNRDYIHGTDIYNSIIPHITTKDCINFKIKFREKIKNNLFISQPCANEKVSIIFEHDSKKVQLSLVEDKTNATGRYEYDEDKVNENSTIDREEKSIRSEVNNYSAIEHIVAAHKHLLNTIIEKKSWLFTDLEIKSPLPNSAFKFKIKIKRALGKSMVKSELIIDNETFGYITFASKT